MTSQSRWLVLIVLGSLLTMSGYLLVSYFVIGFGFPLDDAWIHQTYARNLALLGEWSFTPGISSAGSTSPLWTIVLACGYLLNIQPIAWVIFLGVICLSGVAWIASLYFQKLFPEDHQIAILAAFVLLFEYHLVWASLSGMETLIYAVVIVFVLLGPTIWNIKPLLLGLVIGVCVWIRPDGTTLIFPYILYLLFTYKISKEMIIHSGLLILGFLCLFLPYLLFNYLLAGSIWPSTLFAKQAEYAVLREVPIFIRLFRIYSLPIIGVGLLFVPGFIWLLYYSARKGEWLNFAGMLWVLGFMFIYALRLPVTYQHGRYIMPAMAVFFIYGLSGSYQLFQAAKKFRFQSIFYRVWMLSTVALAVGFWLLGANAYAQDVGVIQTEMVAMSEYIAVHTHPDDIIAAHDIGALGYFGDRGIYDLAGLITPEVIPVIRDELALIEYINQSGANYLMSFPDWYVLIPTCGIEVHKTNGKFAESFGEQNMALYQWKQDCVPEK